MDRESQRKHERPIAVYGAIAANFLVAAVKFVVAFFTGSSAMLSEGIHSSADTGNQFLLLLGIRRSQKPPDVYHPFGHGKELYFWSLLVAIVLFGVGGGMSVYEGIVHLQHPSPVEDVRWSYIVLGAAFIFEGVSWGIALKEFIPTIGENSVWHAIRESKDPSLLTVLFEDSAALLGLIVAFLGIFLAHNLRNPFYDGAASIVIGVILATVAVLLARESKGLLIGETANKEIVESIRALALGSPGVADCSKVLTMQLGPHQILVNLELQFQRGLSAEAMISASEDIEKNIRAKHLDVEEVFIEVSCLKEK